MGCHELLAKLEARVEQSQQQIRLLMVGLFPVDVDGGGLVAALARLATETAEVHGVECHVDYHEEFVLFDSFTATQLFLIASEATHNAAKHARARQILIRLTNQSGICMTITDNGTGLPPDVDTTTGMGLRIMRYRAALIEAELQLQSLPEGGTMVRCFLK